MARMGPPILYNDEVPNRVEAYLAECVDEITEFHKTRSEGSNSYERHVNCKIPTIEGLAVYLGVGRKTLYEWEEQYPDLAHILDKLRTMQANRLLTEGLSGNYNPTIAKVLLTKHGYREGLDQTTNDKDLPQPLLHVLNNNSNEEDIQPEEED